MQATYAARGLYADGAYYLWKVLESQTFFLFPSRGITQLVTQLPVVAAIRLGVTDVGILARLQSFGTAGFPMIVWAVTFVVLLRHQLFWPFVAIFAVTFLNSGFFSVGEYNCASAFVALSAAILLRGHLKPWSCAGLVLSAVMLPLSYETLAFLGPGLAFLAFLRLRPLATNWTHKRWEAGSLLLAILMYLTATALNVWWTVSPPLPTSLAPVTIAQWIWPIFNDRQLVLSGTIATLYLSVWVFSGRRRQLSATVLLVGISMVLLVPALWNAPWMQYASRGVTGVALFVLLAITALGQIFTERRAVSMQTPRKQSGTYWLVPTALLLAQFVPFTLHTYGWTQWLTSFDTTVTTSHGILTNGETVLKFNDTALYVWPWTDPILSVLLHTHRGQAIILSPGQSVKADLSLPAPIPARFHMVGLLFARKP